MKMEYFNLLHFKKEPFSNSPEPEFLFAAPQYNTCLQMLELAVRLRRGLNIVIGDVGTGKTTLCRKLIQNLSAPSSSDSTAIDTFLLLDPVVESPFAFVKTVAGILGISDISTEDHEWHFKEKIKKFLFEKGVDEQRIIVLIIDEGQKIPDDCLEILREFLNYETNSSKLLQIIIFAQPELEKSLAARANLLDRVNYLYHLKPLNFRQTKAMIEYRISIARQELVNHPLFTFGGMLAIYFATAGYPRKIVSLCHQALLTMIIRGKNKAGWFLMRSCINKMTGQVYRRAKWVTLSLLILAALIFSTVFYLIGPTSHDNQTKIKRVLSSIFIKKESLIPPAPAVPPAAAIPSAPATPSGPEITATSAIPPTATIPPAPVRVDGSESQEKMPAYLGAIPVRKRLTIWRVLDNIYGDHGDEIKQQFILANPQIKDINNTTQGAIIQVPAIQGKALPMKKDTIIVSLENSRDLASLYYLFIEKKNRVNVPALLFLPFWNKRQGIQFTIALDKRFTSMEAANEAIRRLPSELAASAQILSQWDSDTILFNHKFSSN
jgi:general secretion pathway protein A